MDKQSENALTIAAALGIPAEAAVELLHKSIEVLEPVDGRAGLVPIRTSELLSRTFTSVKTVAAPSGKADLTISWGRPSGAAPSLTAICQKGRLVASADTQGIFNATGLGVGQQTIAACYIAGAATRLLMPGVATIDAWPLDVDLAPFAITALPGTGRIDIGDTYLVGAGAIGNGFVWALEPDVLEGRLTLIDGDQVSDGNLQRNVLNHRGDVEAKRPKVDVLAEYLLNSQPHLKVDPQAKRTEVYFGSSGADLRVPRLISAVDSPRARRALQAWLPREVFDASTSGIQEVVFHHNAHPLRGACLECIYPLSDDEQAHERHVAEALGVPLEALSEGIISEVRAGLILEKYPKLKPSQVVGEAYDSLFKRLCGAGILEIGKGRRVLAPLAFVSVLAGALLAVEFQKRVANPHAEAFNFWRLSPWAPPRPALQRVYPKQPSCRFCSDEINLRTMTALWD